MIQTYLQKLKIPELIGTDIRQDQRMKLPMERSLGVLIHHILTPPRPRYEMAAWLAPLEENSLGLDGSEVAGLQDDRIGQALERFDQGRHKDVFFHFALRAIKVFELQCSQIHQDTTTVTFCGKYAGWGGSELLTQGINKDHRPDLKQLVLGLSVSADGSVPWVHKIYDGPQTDDRLHPENHQRLRQRLRGTDFVYVADCKLATAENLRRIRGWGGRFVSVMPRTGKEDALFRQSVREDKVQWEPLLSRRNHRKPDSQIDRYYLACGHHQANGYRLLWIKSTQKAEPDAQSRARSLGKALDALKELQAPLNRYRLKSRPAIAPALGPILREPQAQDWIDYRIDTQRVDKTTYPQRGRPKAWRKGTLRWTQHFSLRFRQNAKAIARQSLTDGVFPLLTNLDPTDDSAKRVREIYKFQPFLEKRHSQIKTWQEVTPVLLKKDERVVAYWHMHVMALMVAPLMERQLPKAMKRHGLSALPLYPEHRPCPYPTMFDLVRAFRGVERDEVIHGENVTLFPAPLNALQKQRLELLEVPASLYQ